jgi:predicted TIM-barrel fold metal-dependent hydrolase
MRESRIPNRLALSERLIQGGFSGQPVLDSHFHLHSEVVRTNFVANLSEIMHACRVVSIAIACCTAAQGRLGDNLMAALAKAAYPDQVYAFGGVAHHLPAVPEECIDLAGQAKTLVQIGFDGIKMIEGKPSVRGALGHPLDAPLYDELYGYLESEQLPLIWHVGDPAHFWASGRVDANMPGREELYGEVDRVLARFPRLRVIFAHFYFMADDLERAGRFLDQHPAASFDLTPHPDMYVQFSRDPENSRAFFLEYQDRILFGTDNHGEGRDFAPGAPLEYWPVYKVAVMRAFLETEDAFPGWHHMLQGIALEPDVLAKIYRRNLGRYVGEVPKALNRDLAIEEGERVLALARRYAIVHHMLPEVRRTLDLLRSPEQLHNSEYPQERRMR